MIRWKAIGLGVAALTFVAALSGLVGRPQVDVSWTMAAPTGYHPDYRVEPGPELAMIFIGSSNCGPSNAPWLPGVVDSLKVALETVAEENGRGFSTIGIARDWIVSNGLNHLRAFGEFDEVMTGRNWINSGLRRYMWDEQPGPASTPQIVLVDRWVASTADPGLPIRNERVVLRKVGTEEIRDWFERGAGIPPLRSPEEVRGGDLQTIQ